MYILIGIILIAFTIALGFVYDRQRFHRTNGAGVEEFESYGKMVKIRAEEGAAKIMGVIAFFAGVGFIIAGW